MRFVTPALTSRPRQQQLPLVTAERESRLLHPAAQQDAHLVGGAAVVVDAIDPAGDARELARLSADGDTSKRAAASAIVTLGTRDSVAARAARSASPAPNFTTASGCPR